MWADRAAGLVGLAAPPLIGADTLAGCNLAVGSLGEINPSTLLDTGLVLGAMLAALAAREFKVRIPRQRRRYVPWEAAKHGFRATIERIGAPEWLITLSPAAGVSQSELVAGLGQQLEAVGALEE